MKGILQVSRRVENVLLNLKTRELPKYLIEDFHGVEGIVPFVGPQRLVKGNILIDRSLQKPMQVLSFASTSVFLINEELSPINMDYIEKRIMTAFATRKAMADEGELQLTPDSAFRAINQLSDGLPGLVVDIYGAYAIIHLYSRHWDEYVQSIARVLTKNPTHHLEGVYLTSHVRGHKKQLEEEKKPTSQQYYTNRNPDNDSGPPRGLCVAGKRAPLHHTVVTEHAIQYHINLKNGAGLYLDQRDNRMKLAALLHKIRTQPIKDIALYGTKANSFLGAKVFEYKEFPTLLNVFSFTCSWSLIAAKMNAQTTSLDLSPTSLRVGQENFKLNGLDNPEKGHVFWEKEAFSGLHALESQEKYFDIVLLDPPTFSRIRLKGKAGPPPKTEAEKKERKQGRVETFTFSTATHYKDLVELAAPLVSPGGYLITFCNTHSMEKRDLIDQVEEAFKLIYTKKQKQIEERRFVSYRRQLRLQGIKKSTREKTIAKMKFEPSMEEVQSLFHFELVDEWGLPADFEPNPELRQKGYLCGLVWRRSYLPTKEGKGQHLDE